jgi:hypothetical protein
MRLAVTALQSLLRTHRMTTKGRRRSRCASPAFCACVRDVAVVAALVKVVRDV